MAGMSSLAVRSELRRIPVAMGKPIWPSEGEIITPRSCRRGRRPRRAPTGPRFGARPTRRRARSVRPPGAEGVVIAVGIIRGWLERYDAIVSATG